MGDPRPFRIVGNGPDQPVASTDPAGLYPTGTYPTGTNPTGTYPTARHRSRLSRRRLRHRGRLVGALLALVLVGGAAVIALTSPGANAATPAVQDLCGTVAPGFARCLAERQSAPAVRQAMLASPNAVPGGYGPADLADAYQLDTSKGFGQTVAVVDAYDDPSAAADLAVYRTQYGLGDCTTTNGCFQKVNQNGTTSPLPGPDRGWAGEISLDLDMVSAVCPQCNILLVEANSASMSDLGIAVDTAVRLGAKFVSNSYGGAEYAGVSAQDVHFNHPGVAITASTGDDGYRTSYPASSPYVTAVGGTTLTRSGNTARGWAESAWAGAGSGCSSYETQPSVQAGVGTSCAGRAMADVSAVANPNTGVNVYGSYSGGGWGVYGGTSASAPIIAATYALAGTPGANDYPNTYPYANAGELYDVTSGTNGSCPTASWCTARAGWDGPTGLGSPDTAAAFSAGGTVSGRPARFGVLGKVTSAQIAGLPVSLSAIPMVPDGDSLVSVTWKAARTDCVFSRTSGLDTSVSCPATLLGNTTVSATAVDTAGVSKTTTLNLSFAVVSSKRPVAITLNVAGQSGSTQSLCTSSAAPLLATVTDVATGLPVKGVPVTFTRQSGTTAAVTAGSGSTAVDGSSTVTVNSAVALTLGAKTLAAGPFAATASPAALPVTVGRCTTHVTGSGNPSSLYYGDPVSVSGTVTRDLSDGSTTPLVGASVQLVETVNGKVQVLGTGVMPLTGSIHLTGKPIASGELGLVLPNATGWTGSSTDLGPITVYVPTTELTATADRSDVGYAGPVKVTGTLRRNAGGSETALAKSSVSIRSTLAGKVTVLGSATVAADGSFTTTVTPRLAGELGAVYAGAPGQPTATVDIGPLTVGTWADAVTLAASSTQFAAGVGVKVTGTVSRSYNGETTNAPTVPVSIYLHTTTGSYTLLTTATTSATGGFSATVAPLENGALVARVQSVAGYTNTDSSEIPVAVSSKLTASAPSVMTGGRPVVVTVSLIAPRAGTVNIQDYVGGNWVTVGTAVATTAGRATISLSGLALGSHSLRAEFDGDSRGGAGTSTTFIVAVRA